MSGGRGRRDPEAVARRGQRSHNIYAISPHREPYSDLDFEFRNFNRTLDHWKSLIKRRTASSGAALSPFKDPLQELAAQR
jgi:hypothetical protein